MRPRHDDRSTDQSHKYIFHIGTCVFTPVVRRLAASSDKPHGSTRRTIEIEQSKYPKPPSTDYMGFVGFRSPWSPIKHKIYDVGSDTGLAQNVVIELEYPEADITIVIEDSTGNHCSGYIQSDGNGIIVIVNSGECRSAITRPTYDYTTPDLHGF